MKGYGSSYSPFVNKVRSVARETGQDDAIAWTMVSLEERARLVPELNPLVKIPVVILDDGRPLYDSAVICDYLDHRHDGPKIIPEDGEARWTALRQQALGDGIAEAVTAVAVELRRPDERQFAPFVERQTAKIQYGLDALDREVPALSAALTIGPIAVACAIGYLDYRELEPGWRETRPAFAEWYAQFARRPSLADLLPPMPPS